MVNKESRNSIREHKHMRMRNRIEGTAQKPRLCVFRSNSHIYAQLIDDAAGRTLAAASTSEKEARGELKETDTVEAASFVGKLVAKRAMEKGISEVVFDRGGFLYAGMVKALAEAAREAGLQF